MNLKIRKTIIYSITAIGILLIVSGGIIFYKYYLSLEADNPVKILGAVRLNPNKNIKMGQKIKCKISLECPWHRKPLKAEIFPGRGTHTVGKTEINIKDYSFGENIWEIIFYLQPFHVGKIQKGKAEIIFNSSEKGNDRLKKLKIPSFEVKAIPLNKKDLNIAEAIEKTEEKGVNPFILTAVIILIFIVAGIILYLRYRNKNKEIILPYWAAALDEIQKLRKKINSDDISKKEIVTELSDIVREYLEKRFHIHAPKQTATEFLKDIDRKKIFVQNKHQLFLKQFMSSAELIKFANLYARRSIIDDALNNAERLVEETKEKDEEVTQEKENA